jgi:hypothetical protein
MANFPADVTAREVHTTLLKRTEIPRCTEVKSTVSLKTIAMGVFTGIGPPCTFVATIVGGTLSFSVVSSSPQPNKHTAMLMNEKIVICFIEFDSQAGGC